MRVKNEMNKLPNDKDFRLKLKRYEQWLFKLGEGEIQPAKNTEGKHPYTDVIEIPHEMCRNSKDEIVDAVFDDFEENIGNPEYFKSRILLAATNAIVNEVNNEMVDRIPGDLHTFYSIDTVEDIDDSTMFPTEFLDKLSLSGLPEHELHLKINTVVILLRNMDIKTGYCNGSQYLVKHIGQFRLLIHELNAKLNDQNKILILPINPKRCGGRSF